MKTRFFLLVSLSFLLNFQAISACDTCNISNSITITENWRCELVVTYNVSINDTCSTYMYSIANYGNGIKDTIFPGDSIYDHFSQGTHTFCFTSYAYYYDSAFNLKICSTTTCKTATKQLCQNPWRLKYSEEAKFDVYPIPAKDHLTISLLDKTNRIKIINQTGQTILDKQIVDQNKFELDVSGYSQGIYFIEISDGVERKTKRFVKQ